MRAAVTAPAGLLREAPGAHVALDVLHHEHVARHHGHAAQGIAAGTVAHDSAMIGDALDAWENGIVSAVNERARCAGLSTGRPLRECLPEMLRS